jgi:pseudaminic acid biosynthesis-associated methylase
MVETNKTEQEIFWSGDFGDEYTKRNVGAELLASNLSLFARTFSRIQKIDSVVEFGANIGLNLQALKLLYPGQIQHAVEINSLAAAKIRETLPDVKVFNSSIAGFDPKKINHGLCDLVLIKGVLIHINPEQLDVIYQKLYDSTLRYILVCEYYNPKPDVINYRGHTDRLFRRDFAGEMLDKFKDLTLVDYGFAYHRDPSFPQDDITWFLLTK